MSENERIERILTAAYVCFTRHGVRRTTMEDIAREADMSRPAVYQYVSNKPDAFRRLTERMLGGALADARAAAGASGTPAERLTGVLEAKLDLVLTVWRDSPAHAAELLGADSQLSAGLLESYTAAMRELLRQTAGDIVPTAEAPEFAELLLAFTRGLEADLAHPGLAAERLRRGVTLLVAGLGSPAGAPGNPTTVAASATTSLQETS
ncbi:TetR/AcrR family transcriptional regulator [Cryobacterium psychrophilum]|nr:TetR/AcrR family transcriptional regulator [Cryobacterium psychrophilum]